MLGSFPVSMTVLGDGGCGKEGAFTWPFPGLLVPCYPVPALERRTLLVRQREFRAWNGTGGQVTILGGFPSVGDKSQAGACLYSGQAGGRN